MLASCCREQKNCRGGYESLNECTRRALPRYERRNLYMYTFSTLTSTILPCVLAAFPTNRLGVGRLVPRGRKREHSKKKSDLRAKQKPAQLRYESRCVIYTRLRVYLNISKCFLPHTKRDILLKRLNANASAVDSASTSDASMFTSPSTIRAGSHITTVNLLDGNESSASASNQLARPVSKKTTAQELQARRQARQAARQAQRRKPSNAPSHTAATEEEKAFWSGGLTSSPSTLFTGAPHPQDDSAIDTSTTQPETETETEEGTPVSQPPEAQACGVDAATGDEDGEGDVTVVLEPRQQTQPRRTFSLLRQSTTRMTMTPGKLASNNLKTEPPPVPSLPRQPSPKTISPPEPAPASTSDSVSDDITKGADRGQIQEDPLQSGSLYSLDASAPEVKLQMVRNRPSSYIATRWRYGS
jgi:hypothetical protein